MSNTYKMSDELLGRIINIIQEAFLTGTDALDLFRQMEMQPSDEDPHCLVLTEDYRQTVDRWHQQIEDDINRVEKEMRDQQAMACPEGYLVGTGENVPTDGVGGFIDLGSLSDKVKVN